MRTKQETFDQVVSHLRKQGRKSFYGGGCAYRGDDGTMCAAGCLIPDSLYSPSMENKTVFHEDVSHVITSLGYDADFVLTLQYVHDKKAIEDWEREFERIAKESGLTYTLPEPAP